MCSNFILQAKLYIRTFFFTLLLTLVINNCFSKTFDGNALEVNKKPSDSDSSSKDTSTIKLPTSENGPEQPVNYSARDSIELDNVKKVIHLYGKAKVIYGKMTVEADKIIIYLDKNEVQAFGLRDNIGKLIEPVKFKDGDDFFDCPEMAYNFKSKKGKIIDIYTKEGDLHLHAQKAKRMPDESIFVKKGKITTCDHPEPHFYFEASKLKVIPEKVMVAGFTHLVIRDLHTPLFVPFGIFPNNKQKQSGVIIPSQGSDNGQTGFTDLGYHWAINDYVHSELLGSLFFGGTFRTNLTTTYSKKYKYTGDISLKHNNVVTGTKGLSNYKVQKDYNLVWNHRQDIKAHPKNNFSAGINLQSSSYRNTQQLTHTTAATSVQGANISQLKFDRREKWGTISVNSTFNQNFQTKKTTLNAPGITLNVRNQKLIGALQMSGSANFVNTVTADDSAFWEQFNDKLKNGLKATTVLDFGRSYKLLKYFNLTLPNLTVNGYLNSKYINKTFEGDTLRTDVIKRAKASYDMKLGNFGLNTKVYGVFEFKDGMKIKGFRHTMTPGVTFSYSPDFFIESQDIKRTYFDSVYAKQVEYSIYENTNYSVYTPSATEQLNLNYSLMNNLQAKVRQGADSSDTYKKVNVLNNFDINGSYNFLADSMNWSDVNVNLNTNPGFLKNLNVRAVLSPYDIDSLGQKKNVLLWKNNSIGKWTYLGVGTNITLSRKDFLPKGIPSTQTGVFNWLLNVTYTFDYRPYSTGSQLNNTLTLAGNVTLTKNWSFQFNAPYNFQTNTISKISSVSFVRQIHCWEILLNWLPFSDRANYTFTIRPKAGILSDLKWEKKSINN